MGKPHACWRGAASAVTRWLCFLDADLCATPFLVATAIATAKKQGIDMLSVSPFLALQSFWERLIVPSGLPLIWTCAASTIPQRRMSPPTASSCCSPRSLSRYGRT
jgi:hypothetical protein